MNSTLLLVGVAVVVGLLLFLAAPSDQTQTEVAAADLPAPEIIGTARLGTAGGPPVVDVGPDRVVRERETVRLAATASASGGEALTYRWTDCGGVGTFEDPSSPTTSYRAPSVCGCEQKVFLTLTATSAGGASASDTMVLTVRDPLSCPIVTYSTAGICVTTSVDPCCPPTPPACPARPAAACASPCIAYVPSPAGCAEEPAPCRCGGCEGGWVTGWLPGAPVVEPHEHAIARIDRHFTASIGEGASMQIRGNISNPACLSSCFTWSASKGWLEGSDTLQPIYHAPMTDRRGGETVTVTLTVHDSAAGRSYDQIRFRIENADAR